MAAIKENSVRLVLDGGCLDLRYALLAEPDPERMRFGVSVLNVTTGECAEVHDVLLSQSEGERLLSRLTAGGVTPVTLREVVEDFLAENG